MTSQSRAALLYGAGKDISMRDELALVFHGSATELPRARWGIFRRVRRDTNGNYVNCPQCRHIGTQGHALNVVCDHCLGVGYLWDESWIRYYRWPGSSVARSTAGYKEYIAPGFLETNLNAMYVELNVKPTIADKVIEVALDDNGQPSNPYSRILMFDIRSIDDYRLDCGRLEYYRLTCMEQRVGYYGQPIGSRTPGDRRMP